MQENETQKLVGSGLFGGILGGALGSATAGHLLRGRLLEQLRNGGPNFKQRASRAFVELGLMSSGAIVGNVAERSLAKEYRRMKNKDLEYRLRQRAASTLGHSTENEKSAALPPRKILGSEFLGLLAGGNTKSLNRSAEVAGDLVERLKNNPPTPEALKKAFSKAKLQKAAEAGKITPNDLRLTRTPADELTKEEAARVAELRKKYTKGFFERRNDMKMHSSVVDKQADKFRLLSEDAALEADKVAGARKKAKIGVGSTVLGTGGGYYYLKKRRAEQGYNQ